MYTSIGTYEYLDWEKFYIGVEGDSKCKFDSKKATIGYNDCNTQTESTSDEIVYSNTVYYETIDGFNFFSDFELKCTVSQTADVSLGTEIELDDQSISDDLDDDFSLAEYASLALLGVQEGIIHPI